MYAQCTERREFAKIEEKRNMFMTIIYEHHININMCRCVHLLIRSVLIRKHRPIVESLVEEYTLMSPRGNTTFSLYFLDLNFIHTSHKKVKTTGNDYFLWKRNMRGTKIFLDSTFTTVTLLGQLKTSVSILIWHQVFSFCSHIININLPIFASMTHFITLP